MFEIREMYTVDGDNVKKFSCVNGKYMLDGTTVEITENGDVLVISENYAPMKICLVFSHEFHKETLFLGDAVERGYGDLQWKACDENRSMPWYFLAYHDGKIQGFGVKTGCNSLCFWNVQKDSVTLTLDIRNGTNPVKLSSRTLKAATLVFYSAEKTAFEGALEFCSKMCEKPRLPKTPIYGGNDWYCNYSNSTFSNILQGAERVSECAKDIAVRPYMVIDDGWQLTRVNGYMGGPWRYANSKFCDMKKMADAIYDVGALPGIWYRPLTTAEYMPKECLWENRWEGQVGHLDPSHPYVLEYIAGETEVLRNWGYKLLKFDYTSYDIFGRYGFQMTDTPEVGNVNFYDETKTTAEIIKQLYTTIRNAATDDVAIIGCNTIGHLGAGIFELQRTGDDTSGKEWARTKKMGVNTLAFRMCQHNRFFACDADCVGITDLVPWKNNSLWLDVLAQSGTPLFVSVAENSFGEIQKQEIKKAFETNVAVALSTELLQPCDWLETLTPSRWERNGQSFVYDWDI